MEKRLWENTHSEEELRDINSAAEILNEIISLYAFKIAEEKKKKPCDTDAVASLEADLSRFQSERDKISDIRVVKKVLNLYAPSLQEMIVHGVTVPKKKKQ